MVFKFFLCERFLAIFVFSDSLRDSFCHDLIGCKMLQNPSQAPLQISHSLLVFLKKKRGTGGRQSFRPLRDALPTQPLLNRLGFSSLSSITSFVCYMARYHCPYLFCLHFWLSFPPQGSEAPWCRVFLCLAWSFATFSQGHVGDGKYLSWMTYK